MTAHPTRNQTPRPAAPPVALSERQQECLMWVWYGKGDREIAALLGIAPGTVGGHLAAAALRLGIVHRGCTRTIAALWLLKECQRATGIRLGERGGAGRYAPGRYPEEG